MLVYYYLPNGMSTVPETGEKIYGCALHYPPRDIPYEIYFKYRDEFVDAPYTERWLNKHYKGPFNPISFTYNELIKMPYDLLFNLFEKMQIEVPDHRKSRGKYNKAMIVELIKREIRSI